MSDGMAEAAARVEAGDPDRFAATMATPAPLRARLWPLYAANLEIARAPWVSAEPMIGEMRLQWWVDVFDALEAEGRTPAHEIGPALVHVRPAAGHLAVIASARQRDCWPEPFAGTDELLDYLEATSGSLYAAAGVLLEADADDALRRFGRAAGLAAWLEAVPEFARRDRDLFASDVTPADLATLARAALGDIARARADLRNAPVGARLAMLPGWEAACVLRRAADDPARILAGMLRRSEFARRFALLKMAFRG